MSEGAWLGGLPRRDLWLLPLISFATILILLGLSEIGARAVWPEQMANACEVPDPALGVRTLPNCTATMKAFEGPWYTNVYNECGYRGTGSCRTVPPGTRRIAVIGTSLSEGHLVPFAHSAGVRLAEALARRCPFPVQTQNLASRAYSGARLLRRMDQALALHPALVLMLAGPYDLEVQLDDSTLPIIGGTPDQPRAASPPSAAALPPAPMLAGRLALLARESRAVKVAQSFIVRDPETHLGLFLRYGDKADFLRPPFSAAWTERLRRFDLLIADLAARAKAAGTTLMLAFVPHQSQLALMTRKTGEPATLDPWALPQAVARIAAAHGVHFVDASRTMAAQPKPQSLYYPVDGHPSSAGQEVIGDAIAQHIAGVPNGPFADCARMDRMQEARR